MRMTPQRSRLVVSLASALLATTPAVAAQLVVDGVALTPVAGTYETSADGAPAARISNYGSISAVGDFAFVTHGDGADGVYIETKGYANLVGDPASSGGFEIRTSGDNAAGIRIREGALPNARHLALRTEGHDSTGIDIEDGSFWIRDSLVATSGDGSHGISKTGGSLGTVDNSSVVTQGHDAFGIRVVDSEVNLFEGSQVITTGERAHALLAEGTGEIYLRGARVSAEGLDAWSAVVDDADKLIVERSSLAGRDGVRVRQGLDSNLVLKPGSAIIADNRAVLIDDAVAGRFGIRAEASEITGDIAAGPMSTATIELELTAGTHWQGSSQVIDSVRLDDSAWTLSGNSRVGSLEARNGSRIQLDSHRLDIRGNLESNGAYFEFGVDLGDDSSAAGHLHVSGNASGDGTIGVTRLGSSAGALTTDGIPLITVDGTSLAAFTLTGRAVGGAYEYFLHKGGVVGGEGNWYLRSAVVVPPDPCTADPAQPGCTPVDPIDPINPINPVNPVSPGETVDPIVPVTPPAGVLRPEAGAYLANQSAAVRMFGLRLAERQGALGFNEARRNAWVNVERQQADFSAMGGQLVVDGNSGTLVIGSDVASTGGAVFGVMIGTGQGRASIDSNVSGYRASGRIRGNMVGLYATWLQDSADGEGAYVDGSLQYARFQNEIHGNGLDRERYDSGLARLSLEAGYTREILSISDASLYVRPNMQVSYARYSMGLHTEANATVVSNADAGGTSGRVGVRLLGRDFRANNQVQPYMGVNWLRSRGASRVAFNGQSVAAEVPRNRYEMQAGAEMRFGERVSAWGGLSLQRGEHRYRNTAAQIGLRMAW